MIVIQLALAVGTRANNNHHPLVAANCKFASVSMPPPTTQCKRSRANHSPKSSALLCMPPKHLVEASGGTHPQGFALALWPSQPPGWQGALLLLLGSLHHPMQSSGQHPNHCDQIDPWDTHFSGYLASPLPQSSHKLRDLQAR